MWRGRDRAQVTIVPSDAHRRLVAARGEIVRHEGPVGGDFLIHRAGGGGLDPRRQQARMQERLVLGQDLLLERLAAMSPEARAEFADRLERRLRRGPGGRDGHGSGG